MDVASAFAAPPAIVLAIRTPEAGGRRDRSRKERKTDGDRPESRPIDIAEPSEEDLLLLAVLLDNVVLTRDLEAYRHAGGVLIPLGEFCRLLDLAIAIAPESGTAEGWFLRENRRFRLDLRAGTATLQGKNLPYDRRLIEVHRNDIFVDAGLLGRWLPLGPEIDTYSATLRLRPREPLPIRQRWERERRALPRSGDGPTVDLPLAPNPYALFGSPAIDQTVTLHRQPGRSVPALRYSATVATDIAHAGVQAMFLAEPGRTPRVPHFSVGQVDGDGGPDGRLLGFLRARQVLVGPMTVAGTSSFPGQRLRPGLLIDNIPSFRPSRFDVTTLAGPILPGWEVELYRDTALIGYRAADTAERYEFPDIPLFFGRNRFRLVFHGPHGERREIDRVFNVDSSLVPKGRHRYRFSIQPGADGFRPFGVEEEFGLRKNLSLTLGRADVLLNDGIHATTRIGLRGFSGRILGYALLLRDARTGTSHEYGVDTLIGNLPVELKQSLIDHPDMPVRGGDSFGWKEQTALRIGNIALPRGLRLLPTEIDLRRGTTHSGGSHSELRNRLTYQRAGWTVTHRFSARRETGWPLRTQGQILLNAPVFGHRLQGQATYDGAPNPRIRQITLRRQQTLRDQRLISVSLYRTVADRNTGLTVSVSRSVGPFSYGTNFELSARQGMSLGLTVSLGARRHPETGRWEGAAETRTASGAVLVRTFFDTNANGRRDPDETPLPSVRFYLNEYPWSEKTDADGTLLIDGLTPYQPAHLRVGAESLGDPLRIPQIAGRRFVPRPGNVPVLDFPIGGSGEISGTVREGSARREAAGIFLDLLDTGGRVVASTRSAYDGFFAFNRVRPGRFRLRLTDATGKTLERAIVVPPEGAFLDGVDFLLEKI
ncbi:MAG: carboxypeptidase-like regulatory domain-containing protein [Capsulimonadales bacterium]|nr:carboxypeptidase-like regulatory domain-containing protein [Capsulimonadales bacterium]